MLVRVRVPVGNHKAMNNPIPAEFYSLVRDALNRLYDSPYLEQHKLRNVLLSRNSRDRAAPELRRVLLEAIRAMRPEPGTPTQSRDWRAYRLLEMRFISALSPVEAMRQLNLSRSFFFEEQTRVLNLLIERLWNQRPIDEYAPAPSEKVFGDQEERQSDAGFAADDEVARLIDQARWETVDVGSVLREQIKILETLIKTEGGSLRVRLEPSVIIQRGDRIMLRQILFQLVAEASRVRPGSLMDISLFEAGQQSGVFLHATTVPSKRILVEAPERQTMGLEVCRRLVAGLGGRLVLSDGIDGWKARVEWSTQINRTLLVIDDNPGMAALVARFLVSEMWQVVAAHGGGEARQRLAEARPDVILLDVMLPEEDGWELLIALKTAPETRYIPVVICSAIVEPQVAITLGGAAYLVKPITQAALLEALRPWMAVDNGPAPGRLTRPQPPGQSDQR